MPENVVRATDLTAPERTMTLNGTTYRLVFSNAAARYAEDVYADEYGLEPKKCNYLSILQEASGMRLRAMQAIFYGALRAGGCLMPWAKFDELFTYEAIDGFKEALLAAVGDSLPQTNEKNG